MSDEEQTEQKPKVGAGWGWPALATRMHFFGADHRALCGKWAYSGQRDYYTDELDKRTKPVPDQCKECFRRRAKALGNGPATTKSPT